MSDGMNPIPDDEPETFDTSNDFIVNLELFATRWGMTMAIQNGQHGDALCVQFTKDSVVPVQAVEEVC